MTNQESTSMTYFDPNSIRELDQYTNPKSYNQINVTIDKYEQVIVHNNYFHFEIIIAIIVIALIYFITRQRPKIKKNRKKSKNPKQNQKPKQETTSQDISDTNKEITEHFRKISQENQIVAQMSPSNLSQNGSDDQFCVTTQRLFEDKIQIGGIQPQHQGVQLQFSIQEQGEYIIKTESSYVVTTYNKNELKDTLSETYLNKNVYLEATKTETTQIIEKPIITDLKKKLPALTFTPEEEQTLALEYKELKRKNSHVQNESFETGRFARIFEEKELIGRGGFGEVYKANHKIENEVFAIKKIYLPIGKKDFINQHKFLKEVKILQLLNHKNIIRYNTFWIEQPDDLFMIKFQDAMEKRFTEKSSSSISRKTDSNQFPKFDNESQQTNELQLSTSYSENNSSDFSIIQSIMPFFKHKDEIPLVLYLQMQYCPEKTVKEYLCERKEIEDAKNFRMFAQILEGVAYIHKQGIVHRDLKPANLFLNQGNPIIGDFGLSTDKPLNLELSSVSTNERSMTKNLGTPMYSAPEQLSLTHYDNKVDIYSLGLILFEFYQIMETAHEKNKTMNQLRLQILPESLDQFPNQKALIMQMTQPNPTLRPSVDQILESKEFMDWKISVQIV